MGFKTRSFESGPLLSSRLPAGFFLTRRRGERGGRKIGFSPRAPRLRVNRGFTCSKDVRRGVRRRDRGRRPQLQKKKKPCPQATGPRPSQCRRPRQHLQIFSHAEARRARREEDWIFSACSAAPREPRVCLLKRRSERRSAPRPGSATPATVDSDTQRRCSRQSRHCSWGRWPRFPHLAPRPHPSRRRLRNH